MTVTQNVFSQHITHQTPSQTQRKTHSLTLHAITVERFIVFLLHVNPSYHVLSVKRCLKHDRR